MSDTTNKEYYKNYYNDHKEQLNQINRNWIKQHPEEHKFQSRRYYRMQQYKLGTVESVGFINIQGKFIDVYKGTKGMYWYIINDIYYEISDTDLTQRTYNKFTTTDQLKNCSIAKLKNYRDECNNLDDRIYFDIAIDCIERSLEN